jgi:cysteine synthase A
MPNPRTDSSLANLWLQEKKDMLTIAGAELIQVPAVPYKNPNNYVKYSGRLAEALAKVG